jgi:DnaJ-class molecular chaperone
MARDFYKILGLKRKDKPSVDEIKKVTTALNDSMTDSNANSSVLFQAYRQMALRYHPDKCDAEDAEERFKEIYRAYDVLFNDEKRAVYDEFGEEGLNDDGWGDAEAWRSVYKKVTEELIDEYLAKYKGKSVS